LKNELNKLQFYINESNNKEIREIINNIENEDLKEMLKTYVKKQKELIDYIRFLEFHE